MRHNLLLVFLVSLFSLAFAAPLNTVISAVSSLCGGLTSLLPIAAMLAVVLGGAIYAAGQMMGAETRARANVWATAALTGALFSILISVVAPAVLTSIYGSTLSCTAPTPPAPLPTCSGPAPPGGCICSTVGSTSATCSSGESCYNCGAGTAVCAVSIPIGGCALT